MAQGKESFLFYVDQGELFEELTDEQAGKLIKHTFRYVSDQNPEAPDQITKLLFIPIKQTLKRDLKKYEKYVSKQQANGKKGGRPKKEETQKTQAFLEKPKKADSVSVSVSDSVTAIPTEYSEKQFLGDWNELRKEHLNKPSFLNSISRDETEHFNDLKKQYEPQDFRNALIGLFKQKKMPNGNTTMQSNPKHFLTHFNAYLTAFHDKNNSLYGKEKIETL
jgi:hypothetical protein